MIIIVLPLLVLANDVESTDDLESFALGSEVLDESGWKAFLETSSKSAASNTDQTRRETLNAKVDQDRSMSISVSDEFARKLEKQKGVVGLREKAAKLRADLKQEKAESAAKLSAGSSP